MAKEKTAYVCANCGYDSPRWIGKCPSCGEWNSFVEQRIGKNTSQKKATQSYSSSTVTSPVAIREIQTSDDPRINLHDNELNRVLGGGLVMGSLVLIGGEPGIGKSTLVLQTALKLKGMKVLYVSGEESARQLKLRADRLCDSDGGKLEPESDCQVVCEVVIEKIFDHIENVRPDLVVIDSIPLPLRMWRHRQEVSVRYESARPCS